MSPGLHYPSKTTVGMSDVLFDSSYDSEFPKARGCTQWKIKLQLFGKGGSVIIVLSAVKSRSALVGGHMSTPIDLISNNLLKSERCRFCGWMSSIYIHKNRQNFQPNDFYF